MAYTKNTWKTGDIVSSQKLNHMEDGISNSENVFIVGGASFGKGGDIEGTLDKTWQEIHDAMLSKICIVVITDDNSIVQKLITNVDVDLDSGYSVLVEGGSQFSTGTANGYPAGGGGK